MRNNAEAGLLAVIDSIRDPVWSVDLDFGLLTFNLAARKLFKQTFGIDAAPGMRIEGFLSRLEAAHWTALYERAPAEGPFRTDCLMPDGSTYEMAFNGVVSGGVTTGICIFASLTAPPQETPPSNPVPTASPKSSSALADSEALFRKLFDENASIFLLVDPSSGHIVKANRAAVIFYGYPRKQLMGMPIDHIRTSALVNGKRQSPQPLRSIRRHFNARHRLASGEERDVEVYTSLIEFGATPLLFAVVHDITDGKRAEEALHESGVFLKEAQRIGDLGCYVLDISTGAWTSSETLDRILDIDQAYEHTVAGWTGLIHPDDRDAMTGYFANHVVNERKPFDREYRIVRQNDQGVRWVHGMGKLEFDAAGRPMKMRGIIRDVTERKQAEMQIRQSEERYRATFEQAAIGILHTSLDGRILRCNARFAEIIGYPQEDVPNLSFQQITCPEDLTASVDVQKRMSVGTLGNSSWEKRYVKKDGSLTWVRLTVSTLRDDCGRAQHFIALVEEINSIKAAEQQLAAATEAMRLREVQYRTVFQTSIDGVCITRLSDGRFIDANKAFLDIVGATHDEVVGRTPEELTLQIEPEVQAEMADLMTRQSSFRNLNARLVRKTGEIVWVEISASLMQLQDVPCVLSIVRNVSNAKAADENFAVASKALQASEARYRIAFQTSHNAVNINRLHDGMYLDINQAFLDITGYAREEVIGRTSVELQIWADNSDRDRMTESLRRHSVFRGEVQFKRKNGDIFWGLISSSLFEHDGVPCVLSVAQDISAAKTAEEEIKNLAFYDPLTGLPNRRLLLDRLHQALAASSSGNVRMRALLFVDLDNFKTLNDTLGHQTGDLLLREVARRLTACIRECDTVARLGGDEFVVLLENLSYSPDQVAAEAKAAGEKILAAVYRPYLLDEHECMSTCSIGITVFGDHPETTTEIMQQADIAMYQAKAAGRNTLRFFSPALQAAVNARASLEEDLRQGIEKNQFLLYYQPQISRGLVIGAEALLRWNHPRRGILPPAEFIPTAEDTGLILPLGDWVLNAACRQIALWSNREETSRIRIAVNISALQFQQANFVDAVLLVLHRTCANPANLNLELTESMLVMNVEDVIGKMTELKSHGVKFSLDDFGTGYSSLSYLKRLPLDHLKIDRSFVHDILADASSGAIAQTIISLSRAMGLSVIAEGVETEEQRSLLARLGCHSFQGYLLSRPIPLDTFELLLSALPRFEADSPSHSTLDAPMKCDHG